MDPTEKVELIKRPPTEEYDNLSRNLSKDEDEVFRKIKINPEFFEQEKSNRVDLVNKKLAFDNAGFQLAK